MARVRLSNVKTLVVNSRVPNMHRTELHLQRCLINSETNRTRVPGLRECYRCHELVKA